ncbi:23836_t:CDS:2 [Gigaspora margarita]|uniref:23836_t:CDS:1 n=1 Tax=Gigaspora margarita TaxID=4874 RepID=A0ABN7UJ41_GIGMA|nr:23836_t:CDS:2 [Gigaspora margarita]
MKSDPNTAKEVCDVANSLIKGRRVSSNKVADKLWCGAEVLSKVTNMLEKRRKNDTGTADVSPKRIKRKAEDLKVLINVLLTCYFCPDFVCKIKEALIFKEKEKASHVSIKMAEKELKEKFN